MMSSMRRFAVALPMLVACGDDAMMVMTDADAAVVDTVDAYVDPYPCWPDGVTQVPHGSLTMGGGRGGFHELTDPYPLEWGVQDGAMFVLQLRMTGYAPGDPRVFDSGPRTRVRAYFDETGVPLARFSKCASRPPYVDNGNGAYELAAEIPLIFDTCWRADRLIGQRIRILAEIMDDDGRYVAETRVITAGEPLNEYPMETNTEPCPP